MRNVFVSASVTYKLKTATYLKVNEGALQAIEIVIFDRLFLCFLASSRTSFAFRFFKGHANDDSDVGLELEVKEDWDTELRRC